MASGSRRNRLVAARGAGLFILGFSVVFVPLGLSVTALGSVLRQSHVPIMRVAGALVVVLALGMVATTIEHAWVPWREIRFHPRTAGLGLWGAPVAGAAFAFGWTPCPAWLDGSSLDLQVRKIHTLKETAHQSSVHATDKISMVLGEIGEDVASDSCDPSCCGS